MGFTSLFASGPAQPETVAGILTQVSDWVGRLDAVSVHHNEQIELENAAILAAQANIAESTAEITAARKAAQNLRSLIAG